MFRGPCCCRWDAGCPLKGTTPPLPPRPPGDRHGLGTIWNCIIGPNTFTMLKQPKKCITRTTVETLLPVHPSIKQQKHPQPTCRPLPHLDSQVSSSLTVPVGAAVQRRHLQHQPLQRGAPRCVSGGETRRLGQAAELRGRQRAGWGG